MRPEVVWEERQTRIRGAEEEEEEEEEEEQQQQQPPPRLRPGPPVRRPRRQQEGEVEHAAGQNRVRVPPAIIE